MTTRPAALDALTRLEAVITDATDDARAFELLTLLRSRISRDEDLGVVPACLKGLEAILEETPACVLRLNEGEAQLDGAILLDYAAGRAWPAPG